VTSRNSSGSSRAAFQHPLLSTPDSTHNTLDVLAPGKDSPRGANVSLTDRRRRGGARPDKRLSLVDQATVLPFFGEAAEIRVAARWRVNEGLITEARCCEVCERRVRLTGHHESYLRPFDLIFLCGRCHTKRHLRLRAQGRDPLVAYAKARLAGAPHPLPRKRETARQRESLDRWAARVRAMETTGVQ
jgi:hypothetical protein